MGGAAQKMDEQPRAVSTEICDQPPGGSGSWPKGGSGVKFHSGAEVSASSCRPSVHPS